MELFLSDEMASSPSLFTFLKSNDATGFIPAVEFDREHATPTTAQLAIDNKIKTLANKRK